MLTYHCLFTLSVSKWTEWPSVTNVSHKIFTDCCTRLCETSKKKRKHNNKQEPSFKSVKQYFHKCAKVLLYYYIIIITTATRYDNTLYKELGKISTQPHTLCITVILTLFWKRIEFKSQNACKINVWGCVEIFHSYYKYRWWVEFLIWPFCTVCCIITMKSFTVKPSYQIMCFNP